MRRVFDAAHGYTDEATLAMGGPALLDGRGVTAFLAWDGDTAIAGVFVTQVEDTLGVFDMNTDPPHRRRGAAAMLLTHALAAVADGGGRPRDPAVVDAGRAPPVRVAGLREDR